MGLLATNDRNAFGQNFDRLSEKMKTHKSVQFRSRMDGLRKRYELNHPFTHATPPFQQDHHIRAAHETNLPRTATQYSQHGKAWFS
jgi:hypothetical protein